MGPSTQQPRTTGASASRPEIEKRAEAALEKMDAAFELLKETWQKNGGRLDDFERLDKSTARIATINNVTRLTAKDADLLKDVELAEHIAKHYEAFAKKIGSTKGDGIDLRWLSGLSRPSDFFDKKSEFSRQMRHLQEVLGERNKSTLWLKSTSIKLTLSAEELHPPVSTYPEGYTTNRGPAPSTRPLRPLFDPGIADLVPNGSIYGPAIATKYEQQEYYNNRMKEGAEARRTGTAPPLPTLPLSYIERTQPKPAPTRVEPSNVVVPAPGAGRLEATISTAPIPTPVVPMRGAEAFKDILKYACLDRKPLAGSEIEAENKDQARLSDRKYSAKGVISGYEPGEPAARLERLNALSFLRGGGDEAFATIMSVRDEMFKRYDALVKKHSSSGNGSDFTKEAGALVSDYSKRISGIIGEKITSRVPSVSMTPDEVAKALLPSETIATIAGTMKRAPSASAPTVAATVAPTVVAAAPTITIAPTIAAAPTEAATAAPVIKPPTITEPVSAPVEPTKKVETKVAAPSLATAPDLKVAHATGVSYVTLTLKDGSMVFHDLKSGVNYDYKKQVVSRNLLEQDGIEIRKTPLNDGTFYVQVACKLPGDISMGARRGGSPLDPSTLTVGVYEAGATAGSWISLPIDGAYGVYKVSARAAAPDVKKVEVAAATPATTTVKTTKAATAEPSPATTASAAILPERPQLSKADAVAKANWLTAYPLGNAREVEITVNGEKVKVSVDDANSKEKLAKLGVRIRNGNIEFTERGNVSIASFYSDGTIGTSSLTV